MDLCIVAAALYLGVGTLQCYLCLYKDKIIVSPNAGVGKLRPAGQLRSAAAFSAARALRTDFTFPNS